MNKNYFIFTLFLLALHLGHCEMSAELSDKMQKHIRNITDTRNRKGKYLIYNSGGSIRMLCGFLAATFIPKWQNINCLNAWSVGFNMPTKPSDWYGKYKGNINFHQYRSSKKLGNKSDNSRQRFFEFIERNFNTWGGRNGKSCLLRTICEINEAPIIHNGLIGELLHAIFTPGDNENIGEEFKAARRAGQFGADCKEIYSKCPYDKILENFSILGLFTSTKFYKAFL